MKIQKNYLCKFCELPMHRNNKTRHLKTCYLKNNIGFSKTELLNLIKKFDPNSQKLFETQFSMMKEFLISLNQNVSFIHNSIVDNDGRTPEEKIDAIPVSENTKKIYQREFRKYLDWLKLKNLNISIDSANTYISSLQCKDSTAKRKFLNLQVVLQAIINPAVKLNKFRKRISYKNKRPLTSDEIKNFLKEQKANNNEMYLMCKLLSLYGLRVNTISSLKVSHLQFLKQKKNQIKTIFFPDSKVKKNREETIDSELLTELKFFVDKKSDDDFVFYEKGKKLDDVRRARDISHMVTLSLRASKNISEDSNYTLSSHSFRKSRVYFEFQEQVKILKDKARKDLGQSQDSQAVNFYIENN